jgi:phosphoglycolate phosphatase-like HAD superfamily hydrolase
MMAGNTLFVWDFHGTLEKGNVRAVQELLNRVLPLFGLNSHLSLTRSSELYGLSWIDYCQAICPEGNQAIWQKMKEKLLEMQEKEHIVEKYISPMDHADEVLRTIKQKGHDNLILSNSSPRAIKYFVKLVKLNNYIDEYIALDSHDAPRQQLDIGQGKTKSLKRYLKDKSFNKIVKIGDRASDIEAGRAIGAITYFFRNEFNKNHELAIKADHEIHDLREILREV